MKTNKPYTDLETVKLLLDPSSTSTANDDLIETLIPQAQAVIDSILGYDFQTETGPRLYNGNGRDKLLIDKCLDLTKVELLTYQVVNNVRTLTDTVDISGYCALDRTGLVLERDAGYLPLGKQNVRVTGVFGKRDQVPQDIIRAATLLTIHYVKQLDGSYQDKTANSQFGELIFKQQIPADVLDILGRYKPRVFRVQ